MFLGGEMYSIQSIDLTPRHRRCAWIAWRCCVASYHTSREIENRFPVSEEQQGPLEERWVVPKAWKWSAFHKVFDHYK
jgi:hypothetical protein